MYRLALDGSSTRQLLLLPSLVMIPLAIVLLAIVIRSPGVRQWVAIGLGIIGVLLYALYPTTYYRHKLEPSIAAGEELYRRYQTYHQAQGHYPASPANVYFPALDRFDTIRDVRENREKCDSAGVGCRMLAVEVAADERLIVRVYDELIQCDITNLRREWMYRDHRLEET